MGYRNEDGVYFDGRLHRVRLGRARCHCAENPTICMRVRQGCHGSARLPEV